VEVIRSIAYPTATLVKVNVALPEAAERAARTGADGVGLLRAEHMITATGRHPVWFLKNDRLEELTEAVKRGIRIVAEKFYPKPVWYRTFDARTDEFRHLLGGEEEPEEDNPMLGWHGIRRSLDQPELIMAEFEAIKELYREGLDNIGVMIPFTVSVEEYVRAKELARRVGLVPHKMVAFGIMVETPAAALTIEDYINARIDLLSFGTNDLTQLTLGTDRNNARVQGLFNEEHPAVLKLIQHVISVAKEHGVETSICGQAGSRPSMVRKLVRMGIDSVSANIDAVKTIREVVYREERRMLLEAARKLI
jgi:pyruvate,water dikinase